MSIRWVFGRLGQPRSLEELVASLNEEFKNLEVTLHQFGARTLGDINTNLGSMVAGQIDTLTTQLVQFLDGKYVMKASDAAGKETTDDLFIATTKTLKVGTVASPSSITKTLRIPYGSFLPRDDTQVWFLEAGYFRPNAAATELLVQSPLVLPIGVTITKFRIRSYRNAVGDTATASLNKVDDGGFTSIGTTAHATTGWATNEASLSQLVGSEGYMIGVRLIGAAAADARLQFAELDYTMPDYSRGY